MDYGFEHNGKVFTPDGTVGIAPGENAARNEALQQAELAEWATKPKTFLAYYHFPTERIDDRIAFRRDFYPRLTGAYITCWPGAVIGRIVRAHVYRHGLGYRFVAITVEGNNGATYHGRASWDNGSCINLRLSK